MKNDELLLFILQAYASALAQYTLLEMPHVLSPCIAAELSAATANSSPLEPFPTPTPDPTVNTPYHARQANFPAGII